MTPIETLVPFLHRVGVREVTLSTYRYVPRDMSDDRWCVTLPAERLKQGYDELSRTLGNGEEIAFHSLVKSASGEMLHIPMVDFDGPVLDEHLPQLGNVLREWRIPRMALFSSGRSYHGYGLALVEERAWPQFMGRLLLLNEPERPSWIDARWIGHRLMSGSGALRWSWNTEVYEAEPCLFRMLSEADVFKPAAAGGTDGL